MEVIFIKELKGQGKLNEVKKVSDGYAINFLIPNGYAVQATPGKLESLKTKLQIQKEEDKLGAGESELLKKSIEELHLIFKLAFSTTNKAQGSITSQDISNLLKSDYNIDISPKRFKNFKNIKTLGTTNIILNLDYGIKANLKITVERK